MILILGGTGQVGHELLKVFDDTGSQPVVAPSREQLDLKNLEQVEKYLVECQPEVIINAAAYTQVDKAESELEDALTLNTKLPALLAKYCARNGSYLVHYSSDYVYAGEGTHKQDETTECQPLSVYAKTKLAGDRAILELNLKGCIIRTSWVYSPRGHNFMNTMIRLAKTRGVLNVVDDQVGAPTPSFIIAAVTKKAVSKQLAGVYNVCCAGEVSWFEFAKELLTYAHKLELIAELPVINPITTTEYPTPAVRPLNSRLNCSKIEDVLEIKLPSWQFGLNQTMHSMV